MDAMDRELPYFYGKKDQKKLDEIKDMGFTLCLGVALFVSICLFAASFVINAGGERMLINGIRIVALMVILNLMNSLYIVLSRSHNNFTAISKYTVLIAVADISTKVFLVIKFGLYGILWASILTWVLGLLYFYKVSGKKYSLTFNLPVKEIVRLFKIGTPIFIMGFVYLTLRSIDSIMIIRLMDRESLGLYTIALMVSVYVVQLPNLVYAVIFPRFYQAYGEKQNINDIKELFIKPTMVFVLPLLVKYVLPAYLPGLLPAYILLLGSCFLALVNMSNYLLIALNKQIYMVFIGTACIVLGAAANYIMVRKLGLGLSGIAIGTSLTFLVYATVVIAYSFGYYTKAFMEHVKFFARLYSPLIWILVILLILRAFSFKTSGDFTIDLLKVVYKELIFLVGCLPLAYYANKKTAVLALIRNTYFKKA